MSGVRQTPGSGEPGRHVISVVVRDRPGVLDRVSSLARARGFNIRSLSVGPSEVAGRSRLTLVLGGDDHAVEQFTKQLHRLVDTLSVRDIPTARRIERELVLVRIACVVGTCSDALAIAESHGARVADIAGDTIVFQYVDRPDAVEAFLALLAPFGIRELVRGGSLAMARGPRDRTDG